MAARAGGTAASVTQSFLWSNSRPAKRGCKSEDECCSHGNGGREGEHAPVEREPRCADGLGNQRLQKSHRGQRERESRKCAESGKHHAFGEKLCDQSSTSG